MEPTHKPRFIQFLQKVKRSRSEKKLGGVCGGLAAHSDVPAWVYRSLPRVKVIATFAISALLSVFIISCSNPQSSKPSRSQVLGDFIVTLDGYTQDAGSAWKAVILATNTSSIKIGGVAFSYAAGFPLMDSTVIATNLDVETLPKRLLWKRREPEINLNQVDPRMMERFGIARVFELQPGEHVRMLLPISVPQAHPEDFVEHFVFAYVPPSSGDSKGEYETYVAELKR